MPQEEEIYILELANGAKFKSTDCSIGFDTDRLTEHKLLALKREDNSILGHITSINNVPVTIKQFNDYVSQYAHQLLDSKDHAEDVAKILKHLGYKREDISAVEKVGRVSKQRSHRNRRKAKIAKQAKRRQRKNK